jgi:N utilization substance protein B
MAAKGRRGSRRLLVQALYQFQISGDDYAGLLQQFCARQEHEAADTEYFALVLQQVMEAIPQLDEQIARWADRPPGQLDPVERAVLWMGLAELRWQPDVPARVVINEAVELAKTFGAQDSYRYINGILDRAAAERS